MRRDGALAAVALAGVLTLAACNGTSPGNAAESPAPPLSPTATATTTVSPTVVRPPTRAAVLHPKRKFFGLLVPGAPRSLTAFHAVASQLHATPAQVGFFMDWTHRFDVAGSQQVCNAGAVPSLTWESWSWEDRRHGATAESQPKYAPRRIANGSQDRYIRRTARRIGQVHCPVIVRLDQEMNGHWYPWGLGTHGMHNSASDYVRMWRHVWHVFHAVHVHNVIWAWSPNYLYRTGIDRLGALYPGDRYVDLVGIDGYLLNPGDTPGRIFGPILRRLRRVAPHRPWFVAETAAPADSKQPGRIRALLHAVATSKRLVGISYLDEPGSRANWEFSQRPASVAAFRRGIADPAFGVGAP